MDLNALEQFTKRNKGDYSKSERSFVGGRKREAKANLVFKDFRVSIGFVERRVYAVGVGGFRNSLEIKIYDEDLPVFEIGVRTGMLPRLFLPFRKRLWVKSGDKSVADRLCQDKQILGIFRRYPFFTVKSGKEGLVDSALDIDSLLVEDLESWCGFLVEFGRRA
ncbi:hypothetical protein FUAX_51630 (plasmid) [Fulvitalea axinellae]|uniref:Uncharacterized protein n=1 Tax=Fulvitalea axinellae TaxID=1182444 RepID=A0AAU9DI07_9BACT|nr:hypothetical protein FUAX_51630 [Fulvitalea axinellae]